ncbi:MAG: AAA family ATPase [Brachymonas sp.]|nr:AAA family ATPase [Brachymonas sp.]
MRFIVVGTSGAGKTSFARELAACLHVPHIELDSLYWLPEWQKRSPDEFQALVASATSAPEWVVDGNYRSVQDIVWPLATDVIWLNYSRWTIHRRVVWRTLVRALTRESLWNGNRESLREALFSRDSIILWSLRTFARNRRRYAELKASDAYASLRWHELRTPREAQRFLAGLCASDR